MITLDPTIITAEQMRAAYDALGLSPERFNDTRAIRITPDGVEILRYQHRPVQFSGFGDAVATELLTIRREGFVDYGDVVALSEGAEGLRERASKLLTRANELDAEDNR